MKIIFADNKEGNDYLNLIKSREAAVQEEVNVVVSGILSDIRENGDEAVIKYTNKFDSQNVSLENILVTEDEIKAAYAVAEKEFVDALKEAAENIIFFHEKQERNSWMVTKEKGIVLGQRVLPLETVGIYVPGGTAAYPSSVLMNALPAKVAGVKNIIMVTPPMKDGKINPNILVAADIAGVDKIYKIGGAQSVGALAFGTETIPKVDKIVGPGNIYVAIAKKLVYGNVDIDMIAGPSEILIIADEYADPDFIAADLMSQAEHDRLASSILVTYSESLAERVNIKLKEQLEYLSRKDIITDSLDNFGAIIIVNDLKEAIDMSNRIAPEHLELCIKNPFEYLNDVKNAGSVFLGEYSPEPLGDYMAGPNHVLPTSGTARFFSALSVDNFVKKSSFSYYTKEALMDVGNKIVKLADTEGLDAHANSIKVRMR
ncbi:MAG: histidinol dehydrogenase [Solirubrobacterales bacterium]